MPHIKFCSTILGVNSTELVGSSQLFYNSKPETISKIWNSLILSYKKPTPFLLTNTIFRVSLVKATPLSALPKPTPRLGGQQVRTSIHSHRWRFKGLNVKSWEGTPRFLRVSTSCSAIQDPTQYLDLGSENYNRGIELLYISSVLYICLKLLQCRILDLRVKAGCSLSFVVSRPLPSTAVKELWAACAKDGVYLVWRVQDRECARKDGVYLAWRVQDRECAGEATASRPWHIINRRTRHGARGRGARRLWDKL